MKYALYSCGFESLQHAIFTYLIVYLTNVAEGRERLNLSQGSKLEFLMVVVMAARTGGN